jgi:hypothetical protein
MRVLASIVFVTASCAHTPRDEESLAWLPMEIGHKWVYDADRGPDVIFEVVGQEDVEGVECFKVIRSLGEETSPFLVSQTSDGLAIHKVGDELYDPPFLEFAFPITKPDARDRVWVGSIGNRTYGIRSRNSGVEEIKLPSGPVKAIRIEENMSTVVPGRTPAVTHFGNTTFWIARGFGVVILKGKGNDPHNPTDRDFQWTLKSFTSRASSKPSR